MRESFPKPLINKDPKKEEGKPPAELGFKELFKGLTGSISEGVFKRMGVVRERLKTAQGEEKAILERERAADLDFVNELNKRIESAQGGIELKPGDIEHL